MSGLKDLSDENLMEMMKEGELKAFDELYNRYSSKTFGFIMTKVKNPTVSSDLHQITWTKVFKKAHTFKKESQFSSWLFKICYNDIIDHFRNDLKNKEGLKTYTDQTKVAYTAYNSETYTTEDRPYLPIETLRSPYKEALQMKYFEGKSTKTISKALDVKTANARKIISRALAMLKKQIEEL